MLSTIFASHAVVALEMAPKQPPLKLFLPLLILAFLPQNEARYGNNDIFTSMEAMRRLWLEERVFVEKVEKTIEDMKVILPEMEKYVKNHKRLKLDQEPNVQYLGHPVNAFNLIKHSATGWKHFHFDLNPKLNETRHNIEYILERENVTSVPDHAEIDGAAFGIARLHSLYSLDSKKLFQEGILEATINSKKVVSAQSALKMSIWDVTSVAQSAFNQQIYTTSIKAFESAIDLWNMEEAGELAGVEKYDDYEEAMNSNITDIRTNLKQLIKKHDLVLQKLGSRGYKHRLFSEPYGDTLSKKEVKKIKKKEQKYRSEFEREDRVEDPYDHKAPPDHYIVEAHANRIDTQKELLCTGKSFRNESETKDLSCFYADNDSPWLKLGPMKVELQMKYPYIAVIRELMFPNECDNITSLLGPHLGEPPGRMSRGKDGRHRNDWTMKNVWPNENDSPQLEKMTRRVEHLTNLLASSKENHSDNFMCGNYGIGGHYGTHPDYNKYTKKVDHINRVATVMLVMDAPEAGGATVWPFHGVNVFPEKGSAVWWFNTRSDSVPDMESKHAACPVVLGQKWIGNKWIHYTSQFRNRPCDLTKFTRYKGVYPRKSSFGAPQAH